MTFPFRGTDKAADLRFPEGFVHQMLCMCILLHMCANMCEHAPRRRLSGLTLFSSLRLRSDLARHCAIHSKLGDLKNRQRAVHVGCGSSFSLCQMLSLSFSLFLPTTAVAADTTPELSNKLLASIGKRDKTSENCRILHAFFVCVCLWEGGSLGADMADGREGRTAGQRDEHHAHFEHVAHIGVHVSSLILLFIRKCVTADVSLNFSRHSLDKNASLWARMQAATDRCRFLAFFKWLHGNR